MAKRNMKSLFKANRVYSVKQVCEICGVTQNAVLGWVKVGLHPSDVTKPCVFQGSSLIAFFEAQSKRDNRSLRIGEFKCFSCRGVFWPDAEAIECMLSTKYGNVQVKAYCDGCKTCATKLLNATQWDSVQKCKNTGASLDTIDEGKAGFKAKTGIKQITSENTFYYSNDRLLHGYIVFMGKYATKTIDAHLIAIRDFERFSKGVAFKQITPQLVAQYREDLIQRGSELGEDAISNSTIRHRASQLRLFLTWLLKQKGYRSLDQTLPEYLDLPNALMAKVMPAKEKVYPTLSEAEEMLRSMPKATRLDRRQRAVFACAFLTGLRANALAGLRHRDMDLQKSIFVQDGTNGRAKNGKSYRGRFFPVPEIFLSVFTEWVNEMETLGANRDDAVFPAEQSLIQNRSPGVQPRKPFEPLKGGDVVRQAFVVASKNTEHHYHPHLARDCLAAFGVELCRSEKERTAWSRNLSHKDIETTRLRYGPMAEKTWLEVMEVIETERNETDDEKDLILKFALQELHPRDPDYEKAKALYNARIGRPNER
ncbi:tyrosine-type recombinase/integrase [Paramylibacter kogurei]|nr:tyrosine-type recombinase/integrase [Amylibacter kogurei]